MSLSTKASFKTVAGSLITRVVSFRLPIAPVHVRRLAAKARCAIYLWPPCAISSWDRAGACTRTWVLGRANTSVRYGARHRCRIEFRHVWIVFSGIETIGQKRLRWCFLDLVWMINQFRYETCTLWPSLSKWSLISTPTSTCEHLNIMRLFAPKSCFCLLKWQFEN